MTVTIQNDTIQIDVGNVVSVMGPPGTNGTNGATGPSGPSGNAQNVTTVSAFTGAAFDAATQVVNIQGYYSVGVGGFKVRRVASQPSHPWKFRSALPDRYLPNGSSDPTNGGWWEGFSDNNTVNVLQFGAQPEMTAILNWSVGYDNLTAFNNAIAYARANIQKGTAYSVSSITIEVPAGHYYCSDTLTAEFKFIMRGLTAQGPGTTGVVIDFPRAKNGFVLTDNDATGHVEFHNITFRGPGDKTDTSGMSGMVLQTSAKIVRCSFRGFSGCGLELSGTNYPALSDYNWIEGCSFDSNQRSGIWFKAANDNNVSTVINCSAIGNGAFGFDDESFLGNTFIACHDRYNGTGGSNLAGGLPAGSDGSIVFYNGRIYAAVPTRGSWDCPLAGSTTPGTNEDVWSDIGPVYGGQPYLLWVSGHTYTRGGSYHADTNSNGPTVFLGCYAEGGGGAAFITRPSMSIMGIAIIQAGHTNSGALNVGTTYNDLVYNGPITAAINKFATGALSIPENVYVRLLQRRDYLQVFSGDERSGDYITGFDTTGNLQSGVSGASAIAWAITKFTATGSYSYTFGSSAPVKGVFYVPQIAIASNFIDAGAAPPTTGQGGAGSGVAGQGWLRLNSAPAVNTPWAWVCTTGGTNGSSSVWTPITVAPVNDAYSDVSTAPTANNLNLTAANISGGLEWTGLDLTANIGVATTATLPLVTDLVTALGANFYIGKTYKLRIYNSSAGAGAWTVTTNTGWTLNGTMAIPQAYYREFIVTFTSATAATLTSLHEVAFLA